MISFQIFVEKKEAWETPLLSARSGGALGKKWLLNHRPTAIIAVDNESEPAADEGGQTILCHGLSSLMRSNKLLKKVYRSFL